MPVSHGLGIDISTRNMAAELPELLGRFIGRLAKLLFFFGEEDDFICLVAAASKFCQ